MKTRTISLCALFSALISVCAWLSFPVGDIAMSLQLFGIFFALGLLGGKRGTLCICVYLLSGAVGLPVFSGFRGGAGVLLGPSGGYITGFLASGLSFWLITALFPHRKIARLIGLVTGLLVCYLSGSVWFYWLYAQDAGALSLAAIFAKCVLPFLLPDFIKLFLAYFLSQKIKRFVY